MSVSPGGAHRPQHADPLDACLRANKRNLFVAGVLAGLAQVRVARELFAGAEKRLDMRGRQEPLGVRQEDVQDPVVDDPAQLLGDQAEQLRRIEHARDFADDRQQLRKHLTG